MILIALIVLIFSVFATEGAGTAKANGQPISQHFQANGQDIEIIELTNSYGGFSDVTLIFKCDKQLLQPTAPHNFVKLGQHYYHFANDSQLNWAQAVAYCNRRGAHLANPRNAIENENIKSYLKENNLKGVWFLDGTDVVKNGDWRWSDDNSVVKYFDWYPGHPVAISLHRCLSIVSWNNYQWYNAFCQGQYKVICQI